MLDPAPSYERIRECAKNWKQFFAFCGLYALTGEADGIELLLADDDLIYRVDTTDAFPISNYQLDVAGTQRKSGSLWRRADVYQLHFQPAALQRFLPSP